ncbi:MAG TPA: GIDE domain-containing protein [Candidatus Omnitrophota bacterium]|nr:GIDE domain-containing protein [Candidatus Omnitrophota bacterium]
MSTRNSDNDLLFWLLAGIVCGVIGFFRGFKIRNKRKLIENIPTSTIRAMAMGLVEINGTAKPFKGTMKTPFSKTDCVFFHYKVEEKRSSGKSSHWVTLKEFCTPEWFYLEDETGKTLVNPVGAELYLKDDRKFNMGSLSRGPDKAAFEQGLIELGISPRGFMGFDKPLRCTEHYVCPGDNLYVMGTATKNPLVELSEKSSENICIQKEGSFFCLSDKSEKELLDSMTWQLYLFLYGGPILTVVCLFILIKQYFPSIF